MASPAPQTNFYVNYGAVTTAVNADVLAPVFIAPRYAIHNSGYGNAELVDSNGNLVTYSGAEITTAQPYPSSSGGQVDTATAQLLANGATVIIGNGGTSKTGVTPLTLSGAIVSGAVTFNEAVAGADTELTLGYKLRQGDALLFSSGAVTDSATVTAVRQAVTPANCEITKAGTSGAVLSGGMVGFSATTDVVYLAAVTSAGESTLNARITGIVGDTGYAEDVSITSGGSASVGNYGLEVEWTSGAAVADVSYQIYCTAGGASGGYMIAEIDSTPDFTPESASVVTSNLVTGLAPVVESDCTLDAEGVKIAANAKIEYLDAQLEIASCGEFFVNYRELLTENANELISGSVDTVKAFAGPAVPENPLGMLYAAGTKSGTLNFYLMSVEDDTDEAYNKALTAAAANEAVYALYPLRQTDEVINHALELIHYYSDPSISQVKRLWLYNQLEQRKAVMESTSTSPVFGSVQGGVLTLASAGGFDPSVKRGSQAVFKNVYIDGVTVPEVTVTIKSIMNSSQAEIVESGVSIPTISLLTVYNVLSASAYAEAVAAKAQSYNNHRVNFVFSEANTTLGVDVADARYIVPILMSLRAANPPHAPLTDLVIPGTSISSSVGFTPTDYETMNNGGVWICYRNRRSEMTTRHAITTGKAGTIAEEDSAVSNGDNILRFVRNSVSFLNGSCNVTPALINKITVNVYQAFDRIMGRAYQDIVGPQILEVQNVEIYQDPNNSAGVIGNFDLNLPEPYLEGNFTFNLF